MTDTGIEGIPGAETWRMIEPVLKGWSDDRKYYIEAKEGNKLLLRLSAGKTFARKQDEFALIKRFNQLDFPMSQALGFGTFSGTGREEQVYMLLTWVEGVPLEDRLTALAPEEQYKLGMEAGRILKRIHSIPCGHDLTGWETAMQAKMLRRIKEYEDCPYHLEDDEQAIHYVKENIGLIHNVEKVWHHGDFHVGNLIYTPEGGIGVIDFNRWDTGDYAEEFYKVQFFDRELSVSFAKGKLDGYFAGSPPDAFWRRQALYVAYSSLFSIKWAIPFGMDEIQGMMTRGRQAFQDYDAFRRYIPRWYTD
ncbi:phosphotransferase family protein [Paenibacillus ihuae]|uniref:phosphotransferase family protein n=1 Tax=Paenibacillus ihuae TaxID=1232431 RepID=UPI0006D5A927|nr:phosphotransferase [Paenibacillus ihuae]